jgi:hypothetical protein
MGAQIKIILATILTVIVIFILMKNSMRYFMFNTPHGRAIMLLIVIGITCLNMPLGLVLAVVIIGLHTNTQEEGFVGGGIGDPLKGGVKKEGFALIEPSKPKNGLDKISTELRVRARPSKSLPVPYVKRGSEEAEPSASEGFASYSGF